MCANYGQSPHPVLDYLLVAEMLLGLILGFAAFSPELTLRARAAGAHTRTVVMCTSVAPKDEVSLLLYCHVP